MKFSYNQLCAIASTAFEALLNALFPVDENCAHCGIATLLEPPYLCPRCLKDFEAIQRPCEKCGRPLLAQAMECPYCNPSAEPYTRRFLAYVLSGPGRQMLHRYKYNGERHLAEPLAALFAHRFDKAAIPICAITSVPSGKKRRRRRGFDHCKELAEALARQWGIPYVQLLTRETHERAQAELNRLERAHNLKDAFQLKSEATPWLEMQRADQQKSGQQQFGQQQVLGILVLDDVLTTGATLDTATELLSEHFPEVSWYQGAVFFTAPDVKNDDLSSNWMFNVEEY